MNRLSIIHFNDVYRVTPQKLSPNDSEDATIDVSKFSAVLHGQRDKWPARLDGSKDGLILFSGDLFSPSVESSVTRGSHMVPVINEIGVTVALTGNHDFDFGYPHLSKLVQATNFPWVLSNVIDTTTSRTPEHLQEFVVLERNGIRIGVIGLVEEEWITTVASWPPNFGYKSMAETGIELSKRLRDPAGGHDHLYYVSKGVTSWDAYNTDEDVLGAEDDSGDVLVVKSGTDFREFSELELSFETGLRGSVRNQIIKKIIGKRIPITPVSPSSKTMANLLKTLLSSVSSALKAPVCRTAVTIDVRSHLIRTSESASGNWFADVIRHAYDDALCIQGRGGADGVLICAGTLRGDSTYGPGIMTIGDILEILPFQDPIIVVELDGAALWKALESSLETWPAQEGRFPVISGFRVSWDSRNDPGNRVLGIWLLKDESGKIAEEPINRDDSRKYIMVTREYMANGHDGFAALLGKPRLVDHENGQLMSSIVRKYLLGSRFINKLNKQRQHELIHGAKDHDTKAKTESLWHRALDLAIQAHGTPSKSHYQSHMRISTTENMSHVDVFDGDNVRQGKQSAEKWQENEDLPVIGPEVDRRLKDQGRSN